MNKALHPLRSDRTAGFTLTELLVAVVLVAVLLSFLLSSFSNLRAKGQGTICISNLKQLAVAANAYAADHNGNLPPYNHKGKYWYLYLMHSELVGTTAGRGILPNENPRNLKDVKTVYHCPVNEGRIMQYSTPNYAYNRALGDSRIAGVEHPHITVMFTDAGYRNGPPQQFYSNYNPDLFASKVCCYITDYTGASFFWERSMNFDLHNGRAHVVFVDGHVEAVSQEDVRRRGADLTMLWGRGNQPINNDQSPNFWSPASHRLNVNR